MGSAPTPLPLWLDCDPGHDDAYALLLAAHDPNVNLLGVTTVHGNSPLEQTSYNTRSILEALDKRDIKVYPGAPKPILREALHAVDIHGESGLDGVTLLPQPLEPAIPGADFLEVMYTALMGAPPNTAWLVSTGTLTNIALLFQKYPDLAHHIKGLSIMGGAVGGGFTNAPMGRVKGEGERFGNWTAFAEFNIYCDPEASHFVLTHPVLNPKTTLVTLDLTHQVLGTQVVRHTLLYGSDKPLDFASADTKHTPSPLRALFTQIMSYFAGTYAEVFDITEGPPLHDPLAVAAAVYYDMFDDKGGERFKVDIVTDGTHSIDQTVVGQLGRTVVSKLPPGQPGCRIPRGIDLARFWELVESCLRRADEVSPLPKLSREELEKEGVFKGLA
ncbi:Inosine/uridine-preferring nucleoside hydrolase [Westerdykella ornata]|uniref:Inosine/uridine-preferring nucleoside hydrolase n=1 Tax=Westerdykella ornata TaxID=318751 RepID=A0A6A6JG13_WESOR|nr:Inosine/uridine-preferring nucleoside hydrolase [Westerdykella ornata]KAF2275093.1 Inosine/uridine-preferring nucleoside hydrolase [Westerdykella ornata]